MTPNRVRIAIRYRPAGDPLPISCGAPVEHDLSLRRLRRHPFRDCRSHQERAVLDAPTGRVFHDFHYGRRGWEDLAWGCLFSDNRRVILARRRYDTDDAGYDKFKLVGPYVAFLEFECFGLTCPEWWNVVDLRNDRKLRELPRDLGANLERVTDLELKQSGSVAVIAVVSGSDQFAPGQLQVWAYDSQGPRRLDEGSIDATSLELNGSVLTWIKDGAKISAVLD